MLSPRNLGNESLYGLGSGERIQSKGKKNTKRSWGQEGSSCPLDSVFRGKQGSVNNVFASVHSQLLCSSVSSNANPRVAESMT